MEAAGDAVRVMTVHAAKGLEAKIVFLPDTCGAPSGRHDPALFAFDHGPARFLAWSPKRDRDPSRVAAARQALRQSAMEEHRRLLYVALTRAEERLYIGGFHGAAGRAEGCWYDMLAASDLGLVETAAPWDATETILHRRDPGLSAEVAATSEAGAPVVLPAWVTTRPEREVSYAPPVRPSNALDAADQRLPEPDALTVDKRSRARRDAARPGSSRASVAAAFARGAIATAGWLPQRATLRSRGAALEPARRDTLQRDILNLLDDPALAPLFGPGSRAEVGIAGRAILADGRPLDITGQIDRVGITDEAVLIADFKTGPRPSAGDHPSNLRDATRALSGRGCAALSCQKGARFFDLDSWTNSRGIARAAARCDACRTCTCARCQ